MSIDDLKAAAKLIEEYGPPRAPRGLSVLGSFHGVKIVKDDNLPNNTMIVSSGMFDMLYESYGKSANLEQEQDDE